MKKRYLAGGFVAVVLLGSAVAAYNLTPTVHAGALTELPELGRPGSYAVGTLEETFELGNRPLITATSPVTGNTSPAERNLRVRLWYPTTATTGDTASYERNLSRDPDSPLPVIFTGTARIAAPALTSEQFPLIVVSHGYGGWAEHMSFLGEHIASHGYVVASIDHADARPEGAVSFLLSFGNVLQNRALDQYQVIEQLRTRAASAESSYAAAINTSQVAVIGYSMGGYGALRTAGATYDYDGEGLGNMPEAAKNTMQEGLNAPSPVQAMIALAPWGGAANNRSWTTDGLSQITVPTLFIAGNQDDVVDFAQGVQWLYDNTEASDRYLLVYREARHNVAGNAIPDAQFPANKSFQVVEYMREPVWRSERINAINQHFITAFLDLHLKGDTNKAAYLNPPVVDSNSSVWATATGEQLNGKLAGDTETDHWRGFQRRWALGMELHHKAASN